MSDSLDKTTTDQRLLRIGAVAAQIGVTTRTLRYWQENELIIPHGHHDGGERLYTAEDVERAEHIKELQQLLGFTLAEIKVILQAEDRLADIKTAYRAQAGQGERAQLKQAALETTLELLAQIDDKLERIRKYRDELAAKADRIKQAMANTKTND